MELYGIDADKGGLFLTGAFGTDYYNFKYSLERRKYGWVD